MCKLVNVQSNINTIVQVSEWKENQIRHLIRVASICSKIDRIILFGSVLEERCTEDSDVDFVVISEDSVEKLSRNRTFRNFLEQLYQMDDYKTEYDILYFKSYEEIQNQANNIEICDELLQKGKTIYAREERIA